MSHSTDPTTPTAANLPPCPPWCDARYCDPTERDVNHRSAPVQVDTSDAVYALSLARADEFAHPDEWNGPPWLELDVTSHTMSATRDGLTPVSLNASLGTGDLRGLIAALAAQLVLAGGAS